MAITATHLTADANTGNQSSYATGVITPTANRLVLAWVRYARSSPVAPTSVTGCGLTWVEVATSAVYETTHRMSLFRALGSSPTSGPVTFNFASTQDDCAWQVCEFANVHQSGTNGSGAVVQSATNTSAASPITVTLAAFETANNGCAGGFFLKANGTPGAGSGFTAINSQTTPFASISEFKATSDTTVDATFSPAGSAAGIAVEIRTVGLAGTAAVTATASATLDVDPRLAAATTATATATATLTTEPRLTAAITATATVSGTLAGVGWAFEDLTADEIARAAADKPLVAALGAMDEAFTANAKWTEDGLLSSLSRNDADFLPSNAHDRQLHIVTKPSLTHSDNEWYLVFELETPGTFDLVMIAGHNFGTIGEDGNGGLTIELQIATDSAFTSNLETLATFTPQQSNHRLVELDLGHTADAGPNRYSNVRFVRLKIARAAGNFVPEVSELFLGRRRQWKHKPTRPWGEQDERSIFADFIGGTGGRIRHVDQTRLATLSGELDIDDPTVREDLVQFWIESGGGTKPFLVILNPDSAPASALWCWMEGGEFRFPEVDHGHDRWGFAFEEDGFAPLSGEPD